MSLFADVPLAPADPILGLTEAFNADPRADKVNLGVGVYLDEDGKLPLMRCVRAAEAAMAEKPWSYLPIDGLPAYHQAVRGLVFGAGSAAVAEGRVVTVQALGGTGALKIGADLLAWTTPGAKVLISDPSWENHRALFSRAGFEVGTYRYYDADSHGVDAEGMLADLRAAEPGTIVVLHACCHNPTGCDLSPEQWDEVVKVVVERGLVAFLDMAYQGFGRGLAADGAAVAKFAEAGCPMLVSNSFSKTFSLYGVRVGSLSVVTASADEAKRLLSRIKIVIRTTYSNPPTHGAAVVAQVIGTPELREMWESELTQMRDRINGLRTQFDASLREAGISDMGFIAAQLGMFSYSGLSKEQMVALRTDHGVYGLDSGRICVAALNSRNLAKVVSAIAAVRG
ncbi:MAG: amino acid aminotransferase [Propionibacteriaceae bacterium]|nr:amino acid aminotransferase [Propionibacteriaceae bacterium]